MADVDYEELVEETVDAVKERVEEDGLDPEQVLAAERANKDRVTLTDWLEERVDETGQDAGGSAADGEPAQQTGDVVRPMQVVTHRLFVAGLLIGIVAAAAVFYSGAVGMGGGTVSAATTADNIETYFSQNAKDIPLKGVRVTGIEKMEGADLYRASLVLSAEFLNRTVTQNQTAVVTPGARYLFLTQPIDTEEPLAGQVSQTQPGAQQQ